MLLSNHSSVPLHLLGYLLARTRTKDVFMKILFETLFALSFYVLFEVFFEIFVPSKALFGYSSEYFRYSS